MNVTEAFEKFRLNLELSQTEQDKAKSLHENVRYRLRKEVDSVEDFLSGSYARNTKIRPLHDIDLFVVFSSGKLGIGLSPGTALEKISRAIPEAFKRYPSASVPKIQNRSVSVEVSFPNINEAIGFDIVPAYKTNSDLYRIPDREAGTWIDSNPKRYMSYLSRLNSWHNKKLIPFIKMIKCWNQNNGDCLKSYHLELLASNIMITSKIYSYSNALNVFFSEASIQILLSKYDPICNESQIDDYLSTEDKNRLYFIFNKAAEKAKLALSFEKAEMQQLAISTWHNILGRPFPTN